jgi:hypothetical protein
VTHNVMESGPDSKHKRMCVSMCLDLPVPGCAPRAFPADEADDAERLTQHHNTTIREHREIRHTYTEREIRYHREMRPYQSPFFSRLPPSQMNRTSLRLSSYRLCLPWIRWRRWIVASPGGTRPTTATPQAAPTSKYTRTLVKRITEK